MNIGLVIFARAPEPGRVKTRLVPALGDAGAARLYAAMLHDVVASVREWPATIWYADALGPEFGLSRHAQRGNDLGERMQHAIRHTLSDHDAALVIGTDAPTLPRRCIAAAIAALNDCDTVVGPSADGGYYLIGARREPNFDGVRWSTSNTFRDTLAANPDVRTIEPWYDIDRPSDLALLRSHLALDPGVAPKTAAALAGC